MKGIMGGGEGGGGGINLGGVQATMCSECLAVYKEPVELCSKCGSRFFPFRQAI